MKHTLKYFFSFCLVLFISLAKAQDTTPKGEPTKQPAPKTEGTILESPAVFKKVDLDVEQKDSVAPVIKTDRYGLRVGIDLFKLSKGLYDNDYRGIEFVGDYRLTKKYYLAAELGTENKTTDDIRLNSTTKGSYLKAGFDYNAYQNWLNMENIISVGLRYGFSTFNQQLNSYKIYNSSPYFGETPAITSGQKFNGLSASWIEVVAGVKAKMFDNVFVGFSLQLKRLVSNKEPDNFENLYIPGFNRTYDGDFGVGFNYTVTYFVPIYKKKTKIVTAPKISIE